MSWLRRAACALGVCALVLFAPSTAWAATSWFTVTVPRASTTYDTSLYPVAYAFDGDAGTQWIGGLNGYPWWLSGELSSPQVVDTYTLTAQYGFGSWTLAGSADNTAWVTLDTETGQTLSATPSVYSMSNTTAYKYYRLTIPSGGSLVSVYEFKLGNAAGVPVAPPAGALGTEAVPDVVTLQSPLAAGFLLVGVLLVFLSAARLVSGWGR